MGAPESALPRWDPVSYARRRITDADGLPDTDRQILLDWCDRLAPRIDALHAQGSTTLIHGDAHVGNLLRDANGQPVLCDFDATSSGPWQADLVAVPVGEARFKRAGPTAALPPPTGMTSPSIPTGHCYAKPASSR
ncbi:phosphotransferase [Polymorphospora sp. NPDC050346]|uniref:phosphotransferase n=1 Tax=Polymorphospora sp. NPDC050346 TaxID=3155780 RepID=UPI0033FA6CB4